MRRILIVFLLFSIIGFQYASAHPFTIETIPAQSSNAPSEISEVIVKYSEAVEIDFSVLKVLDSSGEQIDNKDTRYFEGEESLAVTTPPLEDGVYTVTSKVLSKIDGHLVDYAFVFAVGDIIIDPSLLDKSTSSATIFYPEAGARFPGFVGETIILGSVISSLLIWGTQRKDFVKKNSEKLQATYHNKFMSITGIGLILVFASNILMLTMQTIRLEASAFESLQTTFGFTWIIRMGITIVLLVIWFIMDKRGKISFRNQIPLLILSLALIATASMIGHGAASEEVPPIVLDYAHNLIASIWIGGIIFFGFILLPSFAKTVNEKKDLIALSILPKFSIMFVISLGVLIITGPTLMWFLESNVQLIVDSTYGKLIILKIIIASIMVAFGGYNMFKIQKRGEKTINSGSKGIYKKLQNSLKIEAALGIILLGVVALLVNGTLPAGEVQEVEAQKVVYGFSTVGFSENAKFEISINPFTSGSNTISVLVSDFSGKVLDDMDDVKVKVSNPQRNISPIQVPMNKVEQNEAPSVFQGDLTFGFSGQWQVEVEAQRTQNANEAVIMNLIVKPRLSDLRVEIIEYEFPEESKPLYPLFDGDDSIWISDPSAPRLWKYSISNEVFSSYDYDGVTSMFLTIDNDGKVWFTDTPRAQIGYFDSNIEKVTTISLPEINPILYDTIATFIESDFENNIWIAITNKDVLLKYDQKTNEFSEFRLPEIESLPFALEIGPSGNVWFTESATGKIGYINPSDGKIKEFTPDEPLSAPEELIFDLEGNLWIAEHTGIAIAKFNPVLETFEKIPVPDQEALPYGMSFDRYGNIWIAQHTVDSIAAYDPHNNNLIEVPILTEGSFVQFTTSDSKNNVWFVEQQGNKLGMVKITEIPTIGIIQEQGQEIELEYTELASPLMALGIIATSLFFVKSVKDKRRLNSLITS